MSSLLSRALILPITLIISVTLPSCALQPRDVDVFLVQVSPLSSTLLEQRARIDIRIQNLSDNPIVATGMELQMDVNNRRFARGVSNAEFTIPRLGEELVSIDVSSSMLDTIGQLLSITQEGEFEYDLRGRLYTPTGRSQRFIRRGAISREDLRALAPGL